jgi:hypothetical protein
VPPEEQDQRQRRAAYRTPRNMLGGYSVTVGERSEYVELRG